MWCATPCMGDLMDTVTTFSHGWNRWDTGYVSAYMVLHLILLYAIHTKHPTWVRFLHSIVTVDRFCSFIALAQVRVMPAICTKIDVSVACEIARPGKGHVGTIIVRLDVMGVAQGQWRLIKLSGITHDWDAVIANVLGLGTATMLAWHALNHRLPFNRSLALSLLQFCLLIGTNGLIVDAMRTEWPDKLEVLTTCTCCMYHSAFIACNQHALLPCSKLHTTYQRFCALSDWRR